MIPGFSRRLARPKMALPGWEVHSETNFPRTEPADGYSLRSLISATISAMNSPTGFAPKSSLSR